MILWPSQMHSYQPSADEWHEISKYFAEVYHCPWSHIEPILPVTIACCGKFHIANGGNKIQSSSAVSEVQAETSHDTSFVWASASTDVQLRLKSYTVQAPCLRQMPRSQRLRNHPDILQRAQIHSWTSAPALWRHWNPKETALPIGICGALYYKWQGHNPGAHHVHPDVKNNFHWHLSNRLHGWSGEET